MHAALTSCHTILPWVHALNFFFLFGALDCSCRLWLTAATLATPLPDIQPGALLALGTLTLDFRALSTTLPVSWGSSPGVLPSLQQLYLAVQPVGPLPPEWSAGFRRLATLNMVRMPHGLAQPVGEDIFRAAMAAQHQQARASQGSESAATHPPASSAAAPEAMRLPPGWATGFPNLTTLTLVNLGISGPFPQAWQHGGFPAMTDL